MNDISPLLTCFPDAEAIFGEPPKAIAAIQETCLVALDTNVLLAPYALSDEPLTQIASTYEKLSNEKRLVVPSQVAREFGRNRNAKIGELLKTVQDQMSRQSNPIGTKYAFLRNLTDYETALGIAQEIEIKQKELLASLRKVADAVRGWNVTDPVWDTYRNFFKGCVVELEAAALKEVPHELKFRADHSIPPGYKDEKKSDGGSGDLIIWKTLLQAGRDRGLDLVFVTMDQKADWWTQANGGALFPRYELVEEYRSVTKGRTFHLLRFSEFLAQFGANKVVIEEVQRVEEEADDLSEEEKNSLLRASTNTSPLEELIYLRAQREKIVQRLTGKGFSRKSAKRRGDTEKMAAISADVKILRRDRDEIESAIKALFDVYPYLRKYQTDVDSKDHHLLEPDFDHLLSYDIEGSLDR